MINFKEFIETEALSMQARRKKAISMKKNKAKLAMGRRRQANKLADKGRLMKRAQKHARAAFAKKMTKGIPKSELTPARKAELEKRLDKLAPRIKARAKIMLKDIRKSELARKRGRK